MSAPTPRRDTDFEQALRQPLTGIDAELFTLSQIARDARLPSDLRDRLLELRGRLQRAASDIGDRVDTFLQASDEEVSDFALADLFTEVRSRMSGVSASVGGRVEAVVPEIRVSFARGVLTEALVELVSNALAAAEVDGRYRVVTLAARSLTGEAEITVTDNGPGLPAERRLSLFDRGVTTSGRPGHGLVTQKLNMIGAGGDLVLDGSNETGATFVLRVPTSSATLRLEGE